MLDLINSIYAYVLVCTLFLLYRIPAKYFIVISAHLFFVFLTNDVLFPAGFMPDQFRYIYAASNIRESGFDLSIYQNFDMNYSVNVSNSALFFALFPIPFLDSIYSISIINFILYSLIFIYLYNNKILTGFSIWFYLLYPSLALYSAIGGRDIIILLIMIMSFYQVYKGNSITSVIVATPLLFIKFQNFILYLIALLLYLLIKKYSKKTVLKFTLLLSLAISLLIFSLSLISLDEINFIRLNMFLEDGGIEAEYNVLNSWADIIRYGLTGVVFTFLYPLPWDINGPLQLYQWFENIIIIAIITVIIKKLIKLHNKFKYLLFSYLIIYSSVYGLIVSNYGTLARYKFSFILVFIIFSIKLIHDEKIKKQLNKN